MCRGMVYLQSMLSLNANEQLHDFRTEISGAKRCGNASAIDSETFQVSIRWALSTIGSRTKLRECFFLLIVSVNQYSSDFNSATICEMNGLSHGKALHLVTSHLVSIVRTRTACM